MDDLIGLLPESSCCPRIWDRKGSLGGAFSV
jgi:hypothetical protein